MAPHNFWLKRQLGDIDLPDILFPSNSPSADTVVPTGLSTGVSASATPSSASPTSQSTTASRPTSLPVSATPTQSAIEEEEQQEEEETPAEETVQTTATPTATPTSEAILVTDASTPAAEITSDPVAPSQSPDPSFVIASRTVVVDGAATSSGAAQVGAAKGNAFLENKVLSGIVFAICGVVGLLLIGLVIWVATRKIREKKKLEQEIISWDPDHVRGFNNANNSAHATKDAETRSLEGLDEKAKGPSSLDGHYPTYTLPSQNQHAQSGSPYSNYYGAQQPIQVALAPGAAQPYRSNW